MALSLDSDPTHVYVCHLPTLVAPDPMQTTPYDNKVLALIGNDLQTAIPVILPDNAFARCANARTSATYTPPLLQPHCSKPTPKPSTPQQDTNMINP